MKGHVSSHKCPVPTATVVKEIYKSSGIQIASYNKKYGTSEHVQTFEEVSLKSEMTFSINVASQAGPNHVWGHSGQTAPVTAEEIRTRLKSEMLTAADITVARQNCDYSVKLQISRRMDIGDSYTEMGTEILFFFRKSNHCNFGKFLISKFFMG